MPKTFAGILMGASLGLITVSCEKKTETENNPAESARKAGSEAINAAQETSDDAVNSAKEIGKSAIDATAEAIDEMEGSTQESKEDAKRAGEQMEAILQETIRETLPDGN